jgi:hypothetical protein
VEDEIEACHISNKDQGCCWPAKTAPPDAVQSRLP